MNYGFGLTFVQSVSESKVLYFFIEIFSQNHRNIFNLFWNPPAIAEPVPAGRSDSERRLEGDLEGWRDT